MKIACLQFAPEIGRVRENITRAEKILTESSIAAGDLDVLVLPELAFSGYNFLTLDAITPYLESTSAGISTQWASDTAKRLKCTIIVGYPEVSSSSSTDNRSNASASQELDELHTPGRPVVPINDPSFSYNYNSAVTVAPSGEVVGHYRKSHLYYSDTTWAREGSGFSVGQPFLHLHSDKTTTRSKPIAPTSDGTKNAAQDSKVVMGICMDLNNYNFTAPWTAWEFATHIVTSEANMAIVSMAWSSSDLTVEDVSGAAAAEPELSTLSYWVERLRPVVENKARKVIVVLANRCGIEPGADADVYYAGTTTVMRLGQGEVELWDVLGKGEERLLMVDTAMAPKFRLGKKSQSAEESHS